MKELLIRESTAWLEESRDRFEQIRMSLRIVLSYQFNPASW